MTTTTGSRLKGPPGREGGKRPPLRQRPSEESGGPAETPRRSGPEGRVSLRRPPPKARGRRGTRRRPGGELFGALPFRVLIPARAGGGRRTKGRRSAPAGDAFTQVSVNGRPPPGADAVRAADRKRRGSPRPLRFRGGDRAAVLLDDLLGDREPQAGSPALGGEIGIEQAGQNRRRDARPRVLDGDEDARTFAARGEPDLTAAAREHPRRCPRD